MDAVYLTCQISGVGLRLDRLPEKPNDLVVEIEPIGSIRKRPDGRPYGRGLPSKINEILIKHPRFEPIINYAEQVIALQAEGAIESVYTYWVPSVSVQLNAELTEEEVAGLARIGSSLGITMSVER